MPTMMLPTAPIPVHTAYAVPKGSDRKATAIMAKLDAIAATVAAVGQNRVSPSEYLSPSAQPISSSPAARSAAHPLTALRSRMEPVNCCAQLISKNAGFLHPMFARQACDSDGRLRGHVTRLPQN